MKTNPIKSKRKPQFNGVNKEWHRKHRMPKNASLKEKIKWHEGHAKNCNCRDSKAHLKKLKQEFKKINKKL
ncbi:MAG: hypothetical protein PHI88_01100 [Candidatus Pacebacteria bacterium]|nr:hypothetical protein [Candidatus Paceibacterota bacterium]